MQRPNEETEAAPALPPLAARRDHRLALWARALRLHQWAKNALIFVPVLTAHKFDLHSLVACGLAFAAFCCAASAVYLLNDLVDIDADRLHPTKRERPLARGDMAPAQARAAIPVLLVLAFGAAFAVSVPFAGTLAVYLALTTAYTFDLKRRLLLDVIVLAGLYTLRVIAGAVAIDVVLSEWLLAFSVFMFTSLALIKRYVELNRCADAALPDPANRGYRVGDASIIATLAALWRSKGLASAGSPKPGAGSEPAITHAMLRPCAPANCDPADRSA